MSHMISGEPSAVKPMYTSCR